VPVRIDRRGDGTLEERTLNFTYAPLRDAAGRVDGVFVLAVDVTAQVTAQRAAQESQRRLEAVVQQMPVAVVVAEAPSGRIVASNRQMEELMGSPVEASENPAAYGAWKGFHPNGRPVAAEEWPLAKAVRGVAVSGHEVEFVRHDNTHYWLRISAAPVHDDAGRVTAAVSTFFDITDLRARMPGLLRPR
jgi:PAS domain S-box-containing protein